MNEGILFSVLVLANIHCFTVCLHV